MERCEGDLMWRLRAREAPAEGWVHLLVLLDMHRSDTAGVPENNAVGLQVALVRATPEEAREILPRLGAALAGPEHKELRKAFAKWLRQSWNEDYDLEAGADEALRRELDRLETAGEVVAMSSLTAERWKERQRQKEAQIRTQAMAQGHEFHRRTLASQAARRFGADTGERLSALLARVSEPERLAAVGDAIIDCATGAELLTAARVIVDPAN